MIELLSRLILSTSTWVNVPVPAEAPPIVTPSIVPASISAVSATNESIFAVPSRNKFLHSCALVPKSCVSPLGTKSDANLAFVVIVSALALPRVVFPLTVRLSVTVKSLPIITSSGSQIVIVFVLNTDVISFAVPIIFKSGLLPKVNPEVPAPSALTVSVVLILPIEVSTKSLIDFADARVSLFDDTDDRSVSTLV